MKTLKQQKRIASTLKLLFIHFFLISGIWRHCRKRLGHFTGYRLNFRKKPRNYLRVWWSPAVKRLDGTKTRTLRPPGQLCVSEHKKPLGHRIIWTPNLSRDVSHPSTTPIKAYSHINKFSESSKWRSKQHAKDCIIDSAAVTRCFLLLYNDFCWFDPPEYRGYRHPKGPSPKGTAKPPWQKHRCQAPFVERTGAELKTLKAVPRIVYMESKLRPQDNFCSQNPLPLFTAHFDHLTRF